MNLREGIGFPSTCKVIAPYRRPVRWRDPNRFYRLLGLTPAASDDDIRHAGRELLRKYHPDGNEPDEEAFLAIEEAYRILRADRDTYDATPDGHVVVTEENKNDPRLSPTSTPAGKRYKGWSYFSEVPRISDDEVATQAYDLYLEEALATPTSLPRIAVALFWGEGTPWIEDGLIYVPMSELRGKLQATFEDHSGAQGQG